MLCALLVLLLCLFELFIRFDIGLFLLRLLVLLRLFLFVALFFRYCLSLVA